MKIKRSSAQHSRKSSKQSDLLYNDVPVSDEDNDSMVDNGTDESDSQFEISEDESEVIKEEVDNNKRKVIDDDDNVPVLKKKKKLDKDLYKPPTVEELNQLRETENLFHSNLFRLQIEEVLDEIKIKDKYKKLFDAWFLKLKQFIESIEETEEFKLTNMGLLQKLKIKIPIIDQSKEVKGNYRFLKPSNISVVGSYAHNSIVGSEIIIDVMVEIPTELFQKLDYQNYRYLWKKAMYLIYITSKIGNDIAQSKKFMYIQDSSRPILKIVPIGKLSKKVVVYLHVVAQDNSFKLNRFLPGKNSVRPGWFFNESNSEDDSLVPTPHYNSNILHDLTMLRTNLQNIKIIKEYPNLRDGIILLKIWLRQRQLDKNYNAFNGHVLTMFVLYLLHKRKLNTIMSSYQIIRNVWNCLAQSNWCKSGIIMCENDDSENRISEYHKYYDCVFLDTTGYHNLAADISTETFNWIRDQADLAVKCLDNVQINSFQSLFMRKVPFYIALDHVICFHDTKALENIVETKSPMADKLDLGWNKRAQAIKLLVTVLKEGLGNRVSQIVVLPRQIVEWEITDQMPNNIGKIVIGLELNTESCFDIVTKGPHANLPEAITFRKFWEEKSELRRFQDGTICEAVVWAKGKTIVGKRLVCKKIVTYLLQKKFNLSRHQFLYIADQMEELLRLKKIKISKFAYGTGEEAALQAILAFNSLEKELTSLTELPLSISGIQGSSPVFRYTDVFPPLATVYRVGQKITKESKYHLILREKALGMVPRYVSTIEATIQLLSSGKWPDELEAVQKVKAAFHMQIAECLREKFQLKAQGNYQHVDVMKEGFIFRLSVAHQKEIAFMKQEVGEDGIIRYRDNEESIELEKKLFHLPKLTGALHGLHSQQPSFGPACCLTKRWLSAHLLDDWHIPNIVVELLLASIFLMPEPYKPSQTPQVWFLRFLEVCARNYWNVEPIIVNFNDEMSRDEIMAIENLFGTSRDSLPPLFISTPYDQQTSLWSKKAPTLLILNRISALARESLKIVEEQIFSSTVLNYKPIFRSALSEYDCLIHLKPLLCPRRLQAIDLNENSPIVQWHPYKSHSKQKIPVVNFDPVQLFLQELRGAYDEYALFFHDTYGGLIIGVLLKPTALEPQDFKVCNVNCRKVDANGKLVLNVSAMIEDFYILGKGLMKSIDIQSTKISLN